MRTKSIYAFVFLIMLCLSPCRAGAEQPRVIEPLCETRVNPEAIDLPHPRLSWKIQSDTRDTKQTFYRILVASSLDNLASDKGDLWDSGKVASEQSIQVPYAGKALISRTSCYWKVKVWCGKQECAWSEPASWNVGLMELSDWKAQWIGLDKSFAWDALKAKSRLSARYFRKEFSLPQEVKQAKLYLIGLGLYELYVNGQKVGDQVLAPSPTDFTQEVKYSSFDLTSMLQKGTNAVGVTLGNGRFFAMLQNYKPWKIRTFGFPKMMFQLEITMADGRKQVVLSDASWKVTADGPIRANNEYDGEEYDATKAFPGWNKAGFNDSSWFPVDLTTDPNENRRYFAEDKPQKNEPKTPHGDLTLKKARRTAQVNDNMKVMKIIKPISIREASPDTFILDMGQNMSGWLQIKVRGQKGDRVKLHFAESLKPDGSLYVENLRNASTTDIYTLRGEGVETWEPSFVYHGFRFVEVTGWPGKPQLDDFVGKFVYDDMASVGEFNCSDATLNGIFKNAWWGIASNYKGMPVDCPQRDERQPWLGDRSTGSYGESFLFDNQRLYAKWLDDIQQCMSQEGQISDVAPNYFNYYTDNMTWSGTYLMVAYMLYHQYGDVLSIQKHYSSMQKWLGYMQGKYMTPEYILTKDEYGDWCMPPESLKLIHSQDPARQTDGALISTAYFYKMLGMMQEFAQVLGKPQDKAAYADLASKVAAAFQQKFYDAGKKYYGNNTVTSNILPLAFGITPESESVAVFKQIEKVIEVDNTGHISTGVIGTAWLMRTLSAFGRPDLAFKIASNRTYPSWGYMLENGATTIWELWNGNTANPRMNSQNHVMLLGDLLVWYYENLAGIKSDPEAPGFGRLIMKPDFTKDLTFVDASYHSMHGIIRSDWSKSGNALTWKIELPANTEALVYIPAASAKLVLEGGEAVANVKDVQFVKMDKDRAVFKIGSGKYTFSVL
jgi:alpha-L-rhamnosidase